MGGEADEGHDAADHHSGDAEEHPRRPHRAELRNLGPQQPAHGPTPWSSPGDGAPAGGGGGGGAGADPDTVPVISKKSDSSDSPEELISSTSTPLSAITRPTASGVVAAASTRSGAGRAARMPAAANSGTRRSASGVRTRTVVAAPRSNSCSRPWPAMRPWVST